MMSGMLIWISKLRFASHSWMSIKNTLRWLVRERPDISFHRTRLTVVLRHVKKCEIIYFIIRQAIRGAFGKEIGQHSFDRLFAIQNLVRRVFDLMTADWKGTSRAPKFNVFVNGDLLPPPWPQRWDGRFFFQRHVGDE